MYMYVHVHVYICMYVHVHVHELTQILLTVNSKVYFSKCSLECSTGPFSLHLLVIQTPILSHLSTLEWGLCFVSTLLSIPIMSTLEWGLGFLSSFSSVL